MPYYYSKYNTVVKNTDVILIHNALSNALVEITQDLYDLLQKDTLKRADFDSKQEILTQLLDAKILVEDDEAEFLRIRHYMASRRYDSKYASFTILPTLDCNFSCPYCFETKKKIYLSPDTINSIAKFINLIIRNKNEFNITWFGGEPLLASKQILNLYKKLDIKDKKVDSTIITNGFLLNDTTIRILKEAKIKNVQITLDGTEKTHNSRKALRGKVNLNVFQKTIQNIIQLSNENFANINIRVNLDNKNKHEFLPLYKYLYNTIPNFEKNVSVHPAFLLESTTKGCDKNEICVLSRRQISNYVIELQKKHQFSHPLLYPSNLLYECPVRCDNSWVICPDGSLYKCWEIAGNEDFKVGYINNDGTITITNESLLLQYLEGADPLSDNNCIKCKTYPICGGGCVHARIMKKYYNAKVNTCAYSKDFIEKFISVYYESQRPV